MTESAVIPGVIEGQTEPDCLEGFSHPRFQTELFGHSRAEQELMTAASSNRLHHAWLLTGPAGVGKATLAYRFARHLLLPVGGDGGGDNKGRVAAQIGALSHPHLLVLRRPWQEKTKRLATEITIGEVRRLRAFFAKTAGDGEWRVVIVDRADELNASAANALLKNLEEPPVRCVFLLVCSVPGRLPVTVRSRCRMLKFSPLGSDDLGAAVRSAYGLSGQPEPDKASIDICIPLAQGSVSRALRLLDGGGSDLHGRFLKLISGLPHLDHVAVHGLADELAGVRGASAYELFFELVGESVARIVSHGATGQGATGVEADMAGKLDSPAALAKFAQLWETILRAKADADALNLDRKNLVLGTFFRLEETARDAFA